MSNCLYEEARSLPYSGEADVLVVGGGIAGVAAALAAARSGAKVLIAEKQCLLGGLATSGLVTIYLPLCDGMGRQMSFGIAEELFRLSIRYNVQGRYPSAWLEGKDPAERAKQRFEVQFNPFYFAISCEQLLLEEGVRILYDTKVCSLAVRDGAVEAAILENADGRTAFKAGSFVDATGDASLFTLAGLETQLHQKGNTVAGWYYASTPKGLKLIMLGFADTVCGSERDAAEPLLDRRFFGADAGEISEYLQLSHSATLSDALQKAEAGRILEPAAMIQMPQYRMIRKMKGRYTMTEEDDHREFSDSIGMVGDWRKRGPAYEIPYRALTCESVVNLFAAGRCISADDGMWDVLRVIPPCAVTGEAAGAAAALACHGGSADIHELQALLRQRGQKLTFGELY